MDNYSHYDFDRAASNPDDFPPGPFPMQRTLSEATSYTVDSNLSASTCSSGGYLMDYPLSSPTFENATKYDKSSSYYSTMHDDAQDTDYFVSSTGAQYAHVDMQVPEDVPLGTARSSERFTTAVGDIENAASLAMQHAQSRLDLGGEQPSIISSDAVENLAQRLLLRKRDRCTADRKAVQNVLYHYLYQLFKEEGTFPVDPRVSEALEEAACQLQLRLQGQEASRISYLAIVTVLAELQKQLANEDSGALGQEVPASSFLESPIPEKERFTCLVSGCKQKGFGRSADLDRHYKNVHLEEEHKKKFSCDYRKCHRRETPFFRQDHFRDHLREFHKEDLPRRGSKGDAEWWKTRSPLAMFSGWWRCNRCLTTRVQYATHGFECPTCGSNCEPDRQKHRVSPC